MTVRFFTTFQSIYAKYHIDCTTKEVHKIGSSKHSVGQSSAEDSSKTWTLVPILPQGNARKGSRSRIGSWLCFGSSCNTFGKPWELPSTHRWWCIIMRVPPQGYAIYIISPGDAAQNFTCAFWKALLYNIDEQLNYLLRRMRKKMVQLVSTQDWESGRLGYVLVLSLKRLFNCIILLTYIHIVMSIF